MPCVRTVRAVCCVVLLSGAAVYGQGPTFEAVSIKANRSGESRSSFRGSLSGISVTNQTVIDLIRNVWNVNRLQKIIVDKTGLTGTFDMVLRFNPDANDTSSGLPALFAAVQERLGLKLDAQTAPAEVLVIDRMERPTEN